MSRKRPASVIGTNLFSSVSLSQSTSSPSDFSVAGVASTDLSAPSNRRSQTWPSKQMITLAEHYSTEERPQKVPKVCVGDRVQLDNDFKGIVKFIGIIEGKGNIIYYGIILKQPKGRNDGTFKNHKYFSCEKKHGLFVTRNRIVKVRSKRADKERISMGDTVFVSRLKCEGTVRFVGELLSLERVWFGIELDSPKGTHDGAFNGHRYFQCDTKKGVFRQQSSVALMDAKDNKRTMMDVKPFPKSWLYLRSADELLRRGTRHQLLDDAHPIYTKEETNFQVSNVTSHWVRNCTRISDGIVDIISGYGSDPRSLIFLLDPNTRKIDPSRKTIVLISLQCNKTGKGMNAGVWSKQQRLILHRSGIADYSEKLENEFGGRSQNWEVSRFGIWQIMIDPDCDPMDIWNWKISVSGRSFPSNLFGTQTISLHHFVKSSPRLETELTIISR